MSDYFALLNEPRRPWLDPESLRQKFLKLSTSAHPDRVHNASEAEQRAAQQRYTELNAAFKTLREPRDRLRHLLELERGGKPKDLQEMSADLVELFMQMGQFSRQVDAFLTERTATTSPLLQVPLFERAQAWLEQLAQLQQTIQTRRETVLSTVQQLDESWQRPVDRAVLLPELEQCWRLLSFYDRWLAQLQNTRVQLSL